ncbi:MAG TPA: hypothetical protein VKB88_21490 [Bryobacteraceae bacterium]|nr:hypothetical protein [Bryobacteraceae bacterium]
MTGLEYALYRAARQLLTPAELAIARELAAKADRGVPWSRKKLRRILLRAVFTKRTSAKKAAAA